MMIRWLKPLFLLVGFVFVSIVSAHENTPPEIPPITQRCVTIDNDPPDDWTFEGTIVTFRRHDGVHGFRADTASRYYIAFDSDKQFAGSGMFSPDGQWFVSFWGQRRYATMTDSHFRVTQLVITSTHPRQETYLIPFQTVNSFSFYAEFWPPLWLDDTQFAIPGGNQSWFIVQPFEGVIRPASEDQITQFQQPDSARMTASDRIFPNAYIGMPNTPPRVFVMGNRRSVGGKLLVTDSETQQIYDTCLELTRGYAISPTGDQVAVSIGGEEGFVYILDLNDWTAYRLDLAANPVVAWVGDP